MDTHLHKKTRVFRFSHTYVEEQAWIAYAHPYPKRRGEKPIQSLGKQYADSEVIGQSHYHLLMPCLCS